MIRTIMFIGFAGLLTWAVVTISTLGYYTRKYTDGKSGAIVMGLVAGVGMIAALALLTGFIKLCIIN